MTAPSSQAERFHRARVEFVEAMAAGCTILELRRRRAAQRAALRERAQAEISRIVTHGPAAEMPPAHVLGEAEQTFPYWWMRD